MLSAKFYRYIVFEDGRIYNPQGELIKSNNLKNGYTNVCLHTDDKRKIFLVHRILAHLFLGLDLNSKLTVNHKDSNKLNNKLSNLEVLTQGQNNIHSRVSGNRILKVGHSQVRDIKNMLELRIPQRVIARKHGVSQSFISKINLKKQLSYI